MVERICPACQHGNPLENRYCGACGGPLQQDALARTNTAAIVIAGQQLPVARIKQVGTALAVSLATVAAEAGMAWLRRRAEAARVTAVAPAAARLSSPKPQQATAIMRADPELVRNTVTIVSQRVVEIWEQGSLARQVVEKHVWRKES